LRDGWPQEGYVLKSRNGGVIYDGITEIYFGLPMRRAGFVNEDGHPKWRYHDLRHYAGSIWLMNGLSLYEVSRLLGHTSIKTTERVYAHTLDELSQAREVIDRVSEQHRLPARIRDFDEADVQEIENAG
jgi:integrase